MAPQPLNASVLEVTDFSGGMTDYYIGGDSNKYEKADNLLIVKHGNSGKLFTRPGSEIYDSTNYQIPAGAQRVGTLKYFGDQLFVHSGRDLYYISGGSWVTMAGPSSNKLFPSGVGVSTAVSTAVWNKHLYFTNSDFSKVQKVYKDGGGTWRLRTAGLPSMSAPTVTAGGAGSGNYIYRFLYYYTYTVGTVVYEDRGATVEVSLANSVAPDSTAVAITNIPALANGSTHNYDTASSNLKVEIYRTTDDGQNFFKVGSVNNGTTTFNDTVSDATLQLQLPLYTEDGSPENGEPPLCKYIHVVDDRGFYGHTKEGSEIFSNRVYQSIPGDIDSVPEDYFVDVQDEIAGLSSVASNPIVLCTNFVYRLDGAYDGVGTGFITAQKISDIAGCVSNLSIVQTQQGIFWAGNDGFYFSDGFQVSRVSDSIDKTYQDLIASADRRRRIYGVYEPKKKRIWWAVQKEGDATDCDTCFILDLNFGMSSDMPFTTASGGANFSPTALEFVGKDLIRADSRGYLFRHDESIYTDPKVDTTSLPSTWNEATIIYDYKSSASNFGTIHARKWITGINVSCKNETNLSLQINSINDDGRLTASLRPIRIRGFIVWGDPDIYWGDESIIWNYKGLIDEQRRFPAAAGLRCQYKQIQLTNAQVAVINSDFAGTATVDATLKTVTLDNPSTYDWPTESEDYYIAFEDDSYVNEFLITDRADNVLTVADPLDQLQTAATSEWVIRGKPKGEVLFLLSFSIPYTIMGRTSPHFQKSGTGEVGT